MTALEPNISNIYLLLAKHLNPLLNGLLGLLTRSSLRATEDHLRNEAPLSRQVPLLRDSGVDQRVVVLQVCAETQGLEAGPHEVLVHGVGVVGPRLEMVREGGEFLFEGFDVGGVFEEEDLFGEIWISFGCFWKVFVFRGGRVW